ncbi:MAG: PEP-CTERM sorting domain-containing protein [Armatimonadota bacterium]
MRKATPALALTMLMLVTSCNADVLPWPFEVHQLTDNDGDDEGPDVDNGNIVWSGPGGGSSEIYLWDGSTTTRLSTNAVGDWTPRIHAGSVVWDRGDQIVYWDGSDETLLTGTSTSDYLPVVHDGQVAWRRTDSAGDSWAYFWDGSYSGSDPFIRQLGRDSGESYPMIRNGKVVWSGWDGSDGEIALWNGTSVEYLTDDTVHDYGPVWVGDNQVAWLGGPSAGYAVMLWDNGSVSEIHPSGSDLAGDGDELCWISADADGSQIFYWDGDAVQQVTFGSGHTLMEPVVSDGKVAWLERDGFDYDVFAWDGSSIYQITDNDWTDAHVQISGDWLAWESEVGGSRFDPRDLEIMTTRFPEPATAAMLGTGLVGIFWRRRRSMTKTNGDTREARIGT